MTLSDDELKQLLIKSSFATSGTWSASDRYSNHFEVTTDTPHKYWVANCTNQADTEYLALLSPDTIKSLVTELLELRESDRRKTEALAELSAPPYPDSDLKSLISTMNAIAHSALGDRK